MTNNKIYKISVIGLGYVGLPMSIVLSNVKKKVQNKNIQVFGIEKDNKRGNEIITLLNKNILPFKTEDQTLKKKFYQAKKRNFFASTDFSNVKNSDVIVVSINADFKNDSTIKNIKKLFVNIEKFKKKETLIFIETTLPPGTCDKIIAPLFLKKNKINSLRLCYSYERVTPGKNYYESIINSSRCYSGINKISKSEGRKFLELFINYRKFPLIELPNLKDCEAAKIIENSYRAVNIAFIDEWTKFSNKMNIRLNKIIEAIKLRPTHSNIMRPGIGVGGYCLTKDPKFGKLSSSKFFNDNNSFPISTISLRINKNMPNTSLDYIKKITKIKNKSFLILGASYKEDIGDLRSSPSISLGKKLTKMGGEISYFDPYIHGNVFYGSNFSKKNIFKNIKKFDNIILAVNHSYFKNKFILKGVKKSTNIFDLCGFFSQNKKNKPRIQNVFFLGGK